MSGWDPTEFSNTKSIGEVLSDFWWRITGREAKEYDGTIAFLRKENEEAYKTIAKYQAENRYLDQQNDALRSVAQAPHKTKKRKKK